MYFICSRKCGLLLDRRHICVVSMEKQDYMKEQQRDTISLRYRMKIVFNWFFGVMQGTTFGTLFSF